MDLGKKFGDFLKGAIKPVQDFFQPTNYSFEFKKPQGVQAAAPSPQASMQPTMQQMPVSNSMPAPAPTTSPYKFGQNLNKQELQRKITAGFREYNQGQPLPMEKWTPQLVQAAEKYPAFANNPFLIPAVSLNETSGYKNYTHLNNPLSWGARLKEDATYIPESVEQSINDFTTAVGGDPNRGQGFSPDVAASRMRTANYYKPFRDSGNIQVFSDTYESPLNNPNYYPQLLKFIQMFERQ